MQQIIQMDIVPNVKFALGNMQIAIGKRIEKSVVVINVNGDTGKVASLGR